MRRDPGGAGRWFWVLTGFLPLACAVSPSGDGSRGAPTREQREAVAEVTGPESPAPPVIGAEIPLFGTTVIGTALAGATPPLIAAGAGLLLVTGSAAYTDSGATWFVVTPSEPPVATTGNRLSGPDFTPTGASFDGTNFVVVCSYAPSGATSQSAATVRVSQAGVVLDGLPIEISGGLDEPAAPAVAFDGTNYLVAFYDSAGPYSIHARRLSPAGVLVDSSDIVMTG